MNVRYQPKMKLFRIKSYSTCGLMKFINLQNRECSCQWRSRIVTDWKFKMRNCPKLRIQSESFILARQIKKQQVTLKSVGLKITTADRELCAPLLPDSMGWGDKQPSGRSKTGLILHLDVLQLTMAQVPIFWYRANTHLG